VNPHFRRLTLLLLAFLVALATGFARPDFALAQDNDGGGGSSGDNAAIAINTKSGSSLFKFAFSIRKVAGDVVDNTNAAVAYASCEQCQTTAIAIQIVLVTGSPSVVTPQNLALAINDQCTLCETFAGAYQIVLGTGGPVKLTNEGKRQLWELVRQVRRLREEDLSPPELKTRLDVIVDRMKEVLRTELRPLGPDDDDDDDDEQDESFTDEEPVEEPPPTGPTATDTATAPTTTAPTTATEPPTTTTTATTTATTTTTSPETTTPTTTAP
jgi:putative peptide zinc metalloprotease protein